MSNIINVYKPGTAIYYIYVSSSGWEIMPAKIKGSKVFDHGVYYTLDADIELDGDVSADHIGLTREEVRNAILKKADEMTVSLLKDLNQMKAIKDTWTRVYF